MHPFFVGLTSITLAHQSTVILRQVAGGPSYSAFVQTQRATATLGMESRSLAILVCVS